MIISFWRYSHLALAVSSFLFLTLAAVTGIILAFEPVIDKAKPYKIDNFEGVTLSQVIPVVKEKLKGVQELKVDENDFVIAKYSNAAGNDTTTYIHPLTSAPLGAVQKQKPIFEWTTSLHRSLFLHETGRVIVGITAFLLILIALSGMALIIQRQKGIRRFFASIEKTSFAQYYHTVFGRLSLIFILAIALSGTYLSVSRFIIKPEKVNAKVNDDDIKEEPERKLADFPIFQQIKLSEVETVQLPFSDFPEDYYILKLKDRELAVNQITGDVLAQQIHPTSYSIAAFSLRWHTGRSNMVWAIVLAITAGYILFFIGSGSVITWKRIRNRSKNKYPSSGCKIIILVGSENGSTYRFASTLYKQLTGHGEKVYITDLDKYTVFPQAEHFIVLTSTYGEGDPPSNAKQFAAKLIQHPQQQSVRFSVIGFGSRSYAQFCQFAIDVDHLLRRQSWAIPLMDVMMVNEKSPQDFSGWLTNYQQLTGFRLAMPRELLHFPLQGLQDAIVVDKTAVNSNDTFLVRLRTSKPKIFTSGDLLAVYPGNDHRERLYSIGKVNDEILLSVKLHENGLGSSFLYALQNGAAIKARIIKNQHFHFPEKAPQVIMISNGTGIAPFLGMIQENVKKAPCYLYSGFRNQSSSDLYWPLLSENIISKRLTSYRPALSREGDHLYVSHLLQKDSGFIWQALSNGAVFMICGSLAMQRDVLAVLQNISDINNGDGIEAYQSRGQIVTDCY